MADICNVPEIYQVSVIKDKIHKSPYHNVKKESNIISQISKGYGWPDILDTSDSILKGKVGSSITKFLQSPPENIKGNDKSQCFAGGISGKNTMVFETNRHKCYLSKRCQGKTAKSIRSIDYTCHEKSKYKANINKEVAGQSTPCDSQIIDNVLPYARDQMKLISGKAGNIRCDEGYVAKGYIKGGKLQALAPWECTLGAAVKWSDRTNPKDKTNPKNKWLGECVRDNCPDITIHNSDNEWDVIHGRLGDAKTITCNDGYSFNHDLLHQGGNIQCNYVPKRSGEDSLREKNKMEWFVKDDYLEGICNDKTTKNDCEGDEQGGIRPPEYNPYIHLYGSVDNLKDEIKNNNINVGNMGNEPIGCVWSPESSLSLDNKGTINVKKPGKCHFRKKVDITDNAEPMCKALNCPQKSIPKSDRNGLRGNRPLPGPRHSKTAMRGDCTKADGTIYKDVEGHHDCLCRQHKSCNTCTPDHNCKWCGEGTKGEGTKGGGGCYDIYTNNSACKNHDASPIRQSGGGTCRDDNSNIRKGWLDKPTAEQTIDNCEDKNECMDKHNVDNLGDLINKYKVNAGACSDKSLGTKSLCEAVSGNVWTTSKGYTDMTDKGLCNSHNNKWDTSLVGQINKEGIYSCYYKNNHVNQTQFQPMGFTNSHSTKINPIDISIKPWYCEPKLDASKGASKPDTCFKHDYTRADCFMTPGCEVKENILDDNLINWTAEKGGYKDSVYIGGDGGNCHICSNAKTPNTTLLSSKCPVGQGIVLDKQDILKKNIEFTVDKVEPGKYINLKYNNKDVTIDKTNPPSACELQYINPNGSQNNINNLSDDKCKTPGRVRGDLRCKDGFLYCNPGKNPNCGPKGNPVGIKHNWKSPVGTIPNYCPWDSSICTPVDPVDPAKGANPAKGTLTCKSAVKGKDVTYDPTNDIHFRSNCHKDMSNIKDRRKAKVACSNTGFTINPNEIKTFNKVKKIYTRRCGASGITKEVKKKRCELLNKDNTVHWGKVCISNVRVKKGEESINKVPLKLICEDMKGDWKRNNNGEWNCYDKVTHKSMDALVCPTLTTLTSKNTKKITQMIGKEHYCIIDINKTDDIKEDTKKLRNICSKWTVNGLNSDVEFEFHENSSTKDYVKEKGGRCKFGKLSNKVDDLNTKEQCEENNHTFKKKYSFSNSNFCPIKEGVSDEPDELLNWSGGNVKSDNADNWSSDCASTMLTTCPVNCNEKYGGGGDYVCEYNNHGDESCDIISKQIEEEKDTDKKKKLETNCNSKVNCVYKGGKCELKPDRVKGQMEWKGQKCYELNNEAFAHGIYNYPELDKFFPPLLRLITLSVILLFIVGLLYLTGLTKITASTGMTVIYTIISNMFKGLRKLVLDLIVGIVTIMNDFISALTSGSYLGWFAIILSKWKHLMTPIVILCVISYLLNWDKRAFSLDYLRIPWDYLTTGYSDIKGDVEKEADELDESVIKKVS